MTAFTTYKRWRLRRGVTLEHLSRFVQSEIVPRYRALSPEVELGLERIDDCDSILATQRWIDRDHYDSTMRGDAFDDWWSKYVPILEQWDLLVELEAEWQTQLVI